MSGGLEVKGLEAGNESDGVVRNVVTDMASTKIVLNALANTTYEYGVLDSLNIVSFEMSEEITKICFTQSPNFVFTLPAGVKERKLCDCDGFCLVASKKARKCRIIIDGGYFEFIYETVKPAVEAPAASQVKMPMGIHGKYTIDGKRSYKN